MRVLLVGPGHDDFLVDGIVHGLRTLLGDDFAEVPRADHLYAGHPPERLRRLHGMGFTLGGQLGDDAGVDRDRALYRALDGDYDLVVFADIMRTFGLWTQWGVPLAKAGVPLAVLDTGDRIEPYPYSGIWWRVRQWWLLPRAHTRATYFKREITPWTAWFRTFLTVPGPLASRLVLRDMREIGFSIPAERIVDAPPPKTKDWPAHVVDAEVAEQVGAQTSYAFEDADAYHADLRASRFGVTTKKAGWDALRHYEIAAAGAVPCFRDLDRKPPRSAPHGLDATNCITYRDADDLLAQTAALTDDAYAALQAGALAWARSRTTTAVARQLLADCGFPA